LDRNILQTIRKMMPAGMYEIIDLAAYLAEQNGHDLYLVGGIVRDALLNSPNFDVDLVYEGNAPKLGRQLAGKVNGKLTIHEKFNTAKLNLQNGQIDLATVRGETYARPGALPTVKEGTLRDDMFRRDFTINALAIKLTGPDKGELIDYFGGQRDLRDKLIRVLHENSFIDDATRIWRSVRYEQRLGFQIEEKTLKLLKGGVSYLSTVSGERIRHELELVMKESAPEPILRRASKLNILNQIHTGLKADAWLAKNYAAARVFNEQVQEVYYALLMYRLADKEQEQIFSYLKPVRSITNTIYDSAKLKKERALDDAYLPAPRIFHLVEGYTVAAVICNALAASSVVVRINLQLYLGQLRYVRPELTGNDLLKMGIQKGPTIKKLLNMILDAHLEGTVKTRNDEEQLVRYFISR
jgi:tRNA nucleotidyltransferase (CCA-adding enzyme)